MLIPDYNQDIPESTAEVARAAFPKGNPYLMLRDRPGTIYADEDFSELFPELGQPALAPWRLAFVTVVQFRENLTDRQAAETVRSRIDVTYLLGLDLTDPGFDFSVLSEFRGRLLEGKAEALLLEQLLTICRELELVKARGKQRTDATHVLAAIRVINRLERVAETMRAALNELASKALSPRVSGLLDYEKRAIEGWQKHIYSILPRQQPSISNLWLLGLMEPREGKRGHRDLRLWLQFDFANRIPPFFFT